MQAKNRLNIWKWIHKKLAYIWAFMSSHWQGICRILPSPKIHSEVRAFGFGESLFPPFQVQYEQRIISYALSFVWIEPPMHINPFPKSKPIRTWNRVQKNIFRISFQSQVQENPGNGASNSNMGGETNGQNILTLPFIRVKLFSYVLPYNFHVSVLNPRRAFGADKAHFKGPQPGLACCLSWP